MCGDKTVGKGDREREGAGSSPGGNWAEGRNGGAGIKSIDM